MVTGACGASGGGFAGRESGSTPGGVAGILYCLNFMADRHAMKPLIGKIHKIQASFWKSGPTPFREFDPDFKVKTYFLVTNELFCIAGWDGYFKQINPQWVKTLGYSKEEILGRPFVEFVHPDDVEKTIAEVSALKQGKLTANFSNRYRTSDGRYILLEWRAAPDEATGLIYAAARDVTESRQHEFELNQVMSALDKAAIVALTDAAGKIIHANDNFCRISGYSREELLGKDHSILRSPEHQHGFFRDMWRTIASGKPWSGEIVNLAKNGRPYVVQTMISPIKDLSGRIRKYLAFRFDITKQRESERLLSEAQSVAQLGSWRFDLETQVVVWSPELYKIFAIDPSVVGRDLYGAYRERFTPSEFAKIEALVQRTIATGEPYTITHQIVIDKAGTSRWVRGIGQAIIGHEGKIIGLRGTAQDVSHLVQAESIARQNAKLASLGEMSAGIAHEINNPLAIIAGAAGLLPKALNDPEKFLKRVEDIQRASARIAKIVTGLRKFARTSDRGSLVLKDLRQIAEEAVVLTASKAKSADLEVSIQCNDEVQIHCEEIEIEQVIINLVNNALDAVAGSPDPWVRIVLDKDEQGVILRVEDSGPGIPLQVRGRLFQPFVTSKPIGEGTGLGLSIVRGIVAAHDGTILLREDLPYTSFEIRFPVPKVAAA